VYPNRTVVCREGYGQERYEQVALQKLVRDEFEKLRDARFHFIDGARDIDVVHADIKEIATEVVRLCQQTPLELLWGKRKE
jgi:thymidylate kinase